MKNQIHVIYGKDPTLMTEKLLKATAPLKGLSKNIAIGIKPNLVSATPPSEGAVIKGAGLLQYKDIGGLVDRR
jgi:hypothetical protein